MHSQQNAVGAIHSSAASNPPESLLNLFHEILLMACWPSLQSNL
jgi:hypothetical protein